MKVLLIGQLPKEIGGSYTTGVANVVYELSRHPVEGMTYYTYGTNITDKAAKLHSTFENQYLGYRIRPFNILGNILFHLFKRIREWKRYKEVYCDSPLRFELYRDNFERVIKQLKPDLINVHGSTSIYPLSCANRKYYLPIVQTFHGVSDSDDNEAKRIRPQNILEAMIADYVTVLTPSIKMFAIKTLGVKEDRVKVIANGCDTNKFYFSQEERNRLRREFGIKDTTTVFVTASSVIRRKGQLDFIKVAEQLDIDCQYWVIGKGPDYENCIAYCEEHYLNDKVKFFGYVANSELYKYYSAADVFVHASYREAQALCEIEAYACGMKIILNRAIVNTVSSDTKNSDIYYILDFNYVNPTSLSQWTMSLSKRDSRLNRDWSAVVQEYMLFFNSIINK